MSDVGQRVDTNELARAALQALCDEESDGWVLFDSSSGAYKQGYAEGYQAALDAARERDQRVQDVLAWLRERAEYAGPGYGASFAGAATELARALDGDGAPQ